MTVTLDQPLADSIAARGEFHDDQLRELLSIDDDLARGEAATAYITWLDACRVDATAVRDVAVHRLHTEQRLGALRIATGLGVTRARGQQLIYRAAETHQAASQALAKIRRRLGKA